MATSKFAIEESVIGLVRDRPYLYDKNRGDYKDVIKKRNAWTDIGASIDLSGDECSKLWENLKGQFNAYIRKCKKPTGSGSGKKPFFRHAELMSFCNDSGIDEGFYSNLQDTQPIFTQEEIDEVQGAEDSSSLPSPVSVVSERSDDGYRSHTKYGAKKRKCDPFEEELLKLAKTSTTTSEKRPSEIEDFLAHLVPKMLRIQSKSNLKLTQLQIKIQQLVLEFEEDLE